MARTVTVYNVAPRYTPGSPAQVDQATAEKIARDERAAYEQVMSGSYSVTELHRAERLGLSGIVEARQILARSYRFEDLITGERGERRPGAVSVGRGA